MNGHGSIVVGVSFLLAAVLAIALPAQEKPLRIICFGAHPDDCEIQIGGSALILGGVVFLRLFVNASTSRSSPVSARVQKPPQA